MRRAEVFSIKVNNWQLMNANLEPRLGELPQFQGIQAELAEVVKDARQLESEQEVARKQFTELVRRRQDLEIRGEDVRRRTAALLRGTFGFTSEELIPFGLNPSPRNTAPRASKRKKAKKTEEKSPTPAESAGT